jgi:hypothetical protein
MANVSEAELVKVSGPELEDGDTVYEVVRWGRDPHQVKFNALKVMKSDRGTATCIDLEGRDQQPLIGGKP